MKREEQNKIIDCIKQLTNKEDYFDYICSLNFKLMELSDLEIKKLAQRDSDGFTFYDRLFWETLSGDLFCNTVVKVLLCEKTAHTRKSKETIEDKKLIKLMLECSVFTIPIFIKYLHCNNISYISNKINLIIRKIMDFEGNESSRLQIFNLLNKVNFDKTYNFTKKYPKFEKQFDDQAFFNNLKKSRSVIGYMVVSCSQNETLSKGLKKIINLSKTSDNYNIFLGHNDFISKVDYYLINYRNYKSDFIDTNEDEENFVKIEDSTTNRVNTDTLFIFEKISLPLRFTKATDFDNGVQHYISSSSEIKEDIVNYFQSNFSVFNNKTQQGEWTNKLFIISIRFLSVMESIAKSNSDSWKNSLFRNEFYNWLDEANKIINKNYINDDWDQLKNYLIQENTTVEWKSTIYTSTQELFINERKEKDLSKKIIKNIVKPILGMLNTDGGTILIGVVENPTSVVRKNILENMIEKKGYYFFDINYELNLKKKDLDHVKRDIQDIILTITGLTSEKFNDLWSIEEMEIKQAEKSITILKINIKKSPNLIYEYEQHSGVKTPFLRKRADGRTILVQLNDYLFKENK